MRVTAGRDLAVSHNYEKESHPAAVVRRFTRWNRLVSAYVVEAHSGRSESARQLRAGQELA
jgi:hypothetical protein